MPSPKFSLMRQIPPTRTEKSIQSQFGKKCDHNSVGNSYTNEGFLSFSNNLAERTVKISAIGRKNFLFVASANGGCRAAIHYSPVSSAKTNGVEPYAWLKDVFEKLPYHRDGEAFIQANSGAAIPSDELDYLLPDIWLKANPDHRWTIDETRRAEREAKDA
jgi:transposase